MNRGLALPSAPPPLFAWREREEHARLCEQREEMLKRIASLKPHCHRLVVLQAQLQELTAKILFAETQLLTLEVTR